MSAPHMGFLLLFLCLAPLVSGLNRPGMNIGWTRNQVFAGNQVPRELTQNRPGLISAEQVGAEWFRARLR